AAATTCLSRVAAAHAYESKHHRLCAVRSAFPGILKFLTYLCVNRELWLSLAEPTTYYTARAKHKSANQTEHMHQSTSQTFAGLCTTLFVCQANL
ncbi:MAG: hypothetical protein DWQ10_01960, partial [Calditrichaeota bacterium]